MDLVEQLIDVQVPVASVRQIQEQYNSHGIQGLLYTPLTANTEHGPVPVLLFVHGGGMVIGSAAASDRLCRFALPLSASVVLGCHALQQAVADGYVCIWGGLQTGGWRT